MKNTRLNSMLDRTGMVYPTLVVIVLLYFFPFYDTRNFFIGDDFVWLYQAQAGRFVPTLGPNDISYPGKYGAWAFLYHLIPVSIYNDRPGGFIFIKIIYEIFGVGSATPYYIAILVLHIINVLLFFRFSKLYLSTGPAWIAAALAGTWFYSIEGAYRINAIFDVIAFTASLISVLLFRSAVDFKSTTKYFAAVLFFIFAVRSKEYAICLVPILFMQETIFFNGGFKSSIKRISGYLFISVLLALRYLALYFDDSTEKLVGASSDYRLSYGPQSLGSNLYWYFSEALYKPFISSIHLYGALLAFIAIFIMGNSKTKRIFVFAICSFTLLLGPVLLFAGQKSVLYLYAPHFFIALLLAAALEEKIVPRLLGIALISFITVIPFTSNWRHDSTEWMLSRRGEIKEQLRTGLPIIEKRFNNSTGDLVVFVSGVKPYVNAYVNGWAMLLYLRKPINDLSKNFLYVLGQHTTESEANFLVKFCAQSGSKLYIRYENDVANDITLEFENRCK